jgi:hypothetical protein
MKPAQNPMPNVPSTDESPGVPGFRTWRAVYVAVAIGFVVMVIALTVFAHLFA